MSYHLTAVIHTDKQVAHLSSHTNRCRSDCKLLYYINYYYIISELRTKLKITAYLTNVWIMDNKIKNEVTVVSLDKMIYHPIYETRYRLSKSPDKKRIFSFVKEFLDGKKITESTFWE